MNELGGYRNDMVLALTGLDVEEKSEMALQAFWEASPYALQTSKNAGFVWCRPTTAIRKVTKRQLPNFASA